MASISYGGRQGNKKTDEGMWCVLLSTLDYWLGPADALEDLPESLDNGESIGKSR